MCKLSSQAGKEQVLASSNSLCLHALSRLDNAYPHRGGQSALLSLQIQMLTSCGHALIDTLRIMFDHIPGYPMI